MPENKILRKGEYTNRFSVLPVVPKQYIIYDDNGEKRLFLRFENQRDEQLTSICFNLIQYNATGKTIRDEKIEFDVNGAGNCMFAPEKQFSLLRECTDFRVDMVSAAYGCYFYEVDGNALKSSYRKTGVKSTAAVVFDRTAMYSEMHEKRRAVQARTLRSWRIIIPLLALVLLAVTAFGIYRAAEYYDGRNKFSLDGIEYRFTTSNFEDGPVEIVGYKGNAENITVEQEIEGHPITAIAKNAFAGKKIENLTVNGNIKIEKNAFAESYLKTVTLKGVTKIDESAFFKCQYLTSVSLGDKVTEIGSSAFENCSSLAAVEFPKVLRTLGDKAFYGCSELDGVTLPNTLMTIGNEAFAKCASLEALIVPDSVSSLGSEFVAECMSLTTLSIPYLGTDSETAVASSKLLGNSEGRAALKTLIIRNDDKIEAYAFESEQYLEEIRYLEEIKSIGNQAFKDCSSLKSFKIENNVKSLGTNVFSGCKSLKKVSYSPAIKYIPAGTFRNCEALVEFVLPENTEEIKESAFEGCESLRNLNVPASVYSIETSAFKGCTALKDVVLSDSSIVKLSDGVFENCTALETVLLNDGLREIGKSAFARCTALESIDIPVSVISLERGFLSGCTSLEEIGLPFVGCGSVDSSFGSIFDSTLSGYNPFPTNSKVPESLKKVTVHGGDIASGAFAGCDGIREVVINGNTTSTIGSSAFSECSSLRKITLPVSLTSIESSAFSSCVKLHTIINPNQDSKPVSDFFSSGITLYALCIVKNASEIKTLDVQGVSMLLGNDGEWYATDIAADEFDGNITFPASFVYDNALIDSYEITAFFIDDEHREKLERINISSAVKEIGEQAFFECVNLKEASYSAGSTIKYIENKAFCGCIGLRVITVPSSMISIASDAYNGCINSLVVFNNSSLNIKLGNTNHGYAGYYAEVIVDQPAVEAEDIVISGLSFVNIADMWFLMGCDNQSARVTELNSSSLIYGGDPLEKIYILNNAFEGNTNIQIINIGSNVVKIGNSAFSSCTALRALSMESGVGEIGSNAFDGCTSLNSVIIADSIIAISENCFKNCSSMTSLTLPEGLESIGASAFDGCSSLNLVIIPSSVTAIDSMAFNCAKLYEVVNLSNLNITVGSGNYGNIASNAIKVRTAAISSELFKYINVNENGCKAVFARDNSGQYLCSMEMSNSINVFNLPKFISVTEYDYVIHKTAFDGLNLSYSTPIFMHDSVKGIHASVVSLLSGRTVYYEGTASDFAGVDTNGYSLRVLYYSECIHEGRHEHGEYWRYDSSNTITISYSPTERSVILEPTCTEYGTSRYTCSKCDYYRDENITYLGHSYDSGVEEVPATCTESGVMRISCIRDGCDHSYTTTIHALGHSYGTGVEEVPPTCTENGVRRISCTRNGCGQSYTTSISPLGHSYNYSAGEIVLQPTCISTGTRRYYCIRSGCDSFEDVEIPTGSHNIVDGECTVCHIQMLAVNADNFATVFTNDASYPFVISADGVISSTNKIDASSSTLTFTADGNCTVEFYYYTSSENTFDNLTIKRNQAQVYTSSGISAAPNKGKIELSAGDTVTFTYAKDANRKSGEDCAYIKEFVIYN